MKKFKFPIKQKEDNCQLSIGRYLSLSLVILLLLFLMFLVTNLDYYMREKTDILNEKKYMDLIGSAKDIAPDKREESFVVASNNKKIDRALDFLAIPFSKIETLNQTSTENLILDAAHIKTKEDVEALKKTIQNKKKIIFFNMPSKQLISETELKDILGISEIKERIERNELTLVSGFLLGGVHELEDMKFKNLDVKLMSTTKIYGYSEMNSPAIWRNIYDGSEIYVVNGPFMESSSSTGFMAAIMTKAYKDFLYPIVNTRMTSYEGFPYVSYINTENLEKLYNRNAMKFQHDILLQDILNITNRRNFIPNGYLRLGFSGEQVDMSRYDIKEVQNIKEHMYAAQGDIGVKFSGDAKLDRERYEQIFSVPPKTVLIDETQDAKVAMNLSEDITSVIGPWKEESNFKYLNKDRVYIPFTIDGIQLNGAEKLKFISAVTGLGVIIENLSVEDVIVNKENTESWTRISKEYIEFIDQYRERFMFLESRNAQNASDAVKVFTKNSTLISKNEDSIELNFTVWNGESYFLLRTDKLIESISGAKFVPVEEGTFLITVTQQRVLINLKPGENIRASR